MKVEWVEGKSGLNFTIWLREKIQLQWHYSINYWIIHATIYFYKLIDFFYDLTTKYKVQSTQNNFKYNKANAIDCNINFVKSIKIKMNFILECFIIQYFKYFYSILVDRKSYLNIFSLSRLIHFELCLYIFFTIQAFKCTYMYKHTRIDG